eukprot:5974425-Amphidinium_carterae.1
MGADMNAKVAGIDLDIFGHNALSTCRYGATHRIQLFERLSKRGMRAINTFMGTPLDLTWRHPSGSLSQIDFLILDGELSELVTSFKLEDWGIIDQGTAADHRMLTAVLDLGHQARSKKKSSMGLRFTDNGHFSSFVTALKASGMRHWDGESPADRYMEQLVEQVSSLIDDTKPLPQHPRKPWVSEKAWNYMLLLNKYRRLLSALRRHDTAGARKAAATLVAHEGEQYYPQEEQDAVSGCLTAIKVLTAVKRRVLREDRRAWVDARSQEAGHFNDDRDARNFHLTVKQMCHSHSKRHGRRLMADEGELVLDQQRVDGMWHEHWMKHFGALQTRAVDFEDRSTMVYDEGVPYVDHSNQDQERPSEAASFTPTDVRLAIARMPARKATPDAIPSEAWKPIADYVAEPLSQLFNQYCDSRGLPLAYAGSRVVSIYKKK